jgi:preprotein translocase subunit SecG
MAYPSPEFSNARTKESHMQLILTLLHVAVSIALILIVLLQRGKGASMGASAIIFMLTSLSLAFLFGKGATSSIMEGVSSPQVPRAVPTESAAPVGETQEK